MNPKTSTSNHSPLKSPRQENVSKNGVSEKVTVNSTHSGEINIPEKRLKEIISKDAINNYIKLTKWLYDNHKEVLREYEATLGNLRVEFI
jgi:hypothetical protein